MKQNLRLDYWKELILSEKNEIPDRSGYTPLRKKAIELEELPPSDIEKKDACKFLADLASYFKNFDSVDLWNMILLIDTGTLKDVENFNTLLKKFYDHFDFLGNSTDDDLKKRGYMMSFIVSHHPKFFTSNEILQEDKVKKSFPWLWIESMAFRSWLECEKEVIIEMNANYNYEEFRAYISMWMDLQLIEKENWETILNTFVSKIKFHKNDFKDLEDLARDYGVNLNISKIKEAINEAKSKLKERINGEIPLSMPSATPNFKKLIGEYNAQISNGQLHA